MLGNQKSTGNLLLVGRLFLATDTKDIDRQSLKTYFVDKNKQARLQYVFSSKL